MRRRVSSVKSVAGDFTTAAGFASIQSYEGLYKAKDITSKNVPWQPLQVSQDWLEAEEFEGRAHIEIGSKSRQSPSLGLLSYAAAAETDDQRAPKRC